MAMSGFINRKALENLWRQVDMDQNGTLDFGEFLSLMFLWTAVGNYKTIFAMGDNAVIVSDAFADIQDLFKTYDKGLLWVSVLLALSLGNSCGVAGHAAIKSVCVYTLSLSHTHTAGKLVLEREEVDDLIANHLAPLAHLMPLSQVRERVLYDIAI